MLLRRGIRVDWISGKKFCVFHKQTLWMIELIWFNPIPLWRLVQQEIISEKVTPCASLTNGEHPFVLAYSDQWESPPMSPFMLLWPMGASFWACMLWPMSASFCDSVLWPMGVASNVFFFAALTNGSLLQCLLLSCLANESLLLLGLTNESSSLLLCLLRVSWLSSYACLANESLR